MQHSRGSFSTDVAHERELSYRCSNNSGSVMGSSTIAATTQWLVDSLSDISSIEDASGSKQCAVGMLLEHFPR